MDPDQFGFLGRVADAIRTMLPEDAPPEARDELRAVLFHAWAFWHAGQPVFALQPPVARYLVEARPGLSGWPLRLPAASVYLQLPANLFWASTAPDATPEPVDGMWVAAAEPVRRLHGLLVLGLRPDRPGFSVIRVEAEVPPGGPAAWMGARTRAQGPDFASTLPGGDLGRLYSLATPGEALKLIAGALWYLDQHPSDISAAPDGTRRVGMRTPAP